jgi:AraC-like DNA-binding protein
VKSRAPRQRIPLPAGLPGLHALLTPAAAHAFQTLHVGASINEETQWHAIHGPPTKVIAFETAHGREREREIYNERCINRARRTRKAVLGEHAGFNDFYVPIVDREQAYAVLVVGPFSTKRLTSTDLLERWHWLTGRRGHPSDPEFAQYVATTQETLLLDKEQVGQFERMLRCFARLCVGEGDARALAAEAGELRGMIERSRDVERMWDAARSMVDEQTTRYWLSPHNAVELAYLGLAGLPEHALVGLSIGRSDERDPVEQMLARNAFQRACATLAFETKNVVCGRIAEHGVIFLSGAGMTNSKVRRLFQDLGARVTTLARKKFGLSLHFGASSFESTGTLSARCEQALGAAENALSHGLALVTAEPDAPRPIHPARQLREELATVAERQPRLLAEKFERYVDAVVLQCGYRLELVRAYLEAGFENAARALLASGALGQKSAGDLYASLDRTALRAETVDELVAAFRFAISDLAAGAEQPVRAVQDRSLRRALSFMHEHFAEPITLTRVASEGGFAPRYFSQLFKRQHGTTFEQYLRHLRVRNAQQLLAGTELGIERVGQLSGFPVRSYFHRVFKELTGVTPVEFRDTR